MSQPLLDKTTHAASTIEYPHRELHAGDSYAVFSSGAGGEGAQSNIQITTPNGSIWSHIVPSARSSTEANFKLWESPTLSGGTAMTIINRNRNSTNTSLTAGSLNPVISGHASIVTSGTLLIEEHFGAGKNNPGASRGTTEWLLKSGTNYLFTITSEAASSDIDLELNWYEHANKSE